MASTRRPSRAEQAASNAWLGADGGCIFADAPNAVTSAAVILHQISTHRNITPPRVIRSSRASSRASGGFTTIVLENSSPARSFMLLTRIRWINLCRDRPERCLQTGKRCFTNKGRLFGAAASPRGQPTDVTGAPVNFLSTQWVWGGAGQIGMTYAFTPTWFLDFNYTYAVKRNAYRGPGRCQGRLR
jgi:hypothetical protein